MYTFRVWRRTAAQTDSTLSGVWLHGLPLKGFDKGTTAYTITVDAEFDSLGLTARAVIGSVDSGNQRTGNAGLR